MLTIGRLLGAYPLRKKRTNFELSAFWLIYSLAVVSIHIAYAIYKLNRVLRTPNVKLYHAALTVGHYISTTAIVYAGLAAVLKSRHQINGFCYNISQVHRMLKKVKRQKTYNPSRVVLYIVGYLVMISIVKLIVRGQLPSLKTFVKEFSSMSCHLGVIGSVTVFSAFVGMIDKELGALNEMLMKAIQSPGGRVRIALMTDIHYTLSTTADDLNSCFYQSYFMIICGSTLSETSSISSMTYNVFTTKDYCEGVIQFMWVVFWFVAIFAIVIPCSSAVHHSKKFNQELSLMVIQGNHSKELMEGEKEKLQLHLVFDFTVCFDCGLFQLDRPLIHSILGNVTSFATILTQVAIIQGV